MILSIIILIILLIYIFYSDSLSVNDFKKHIEDKPVLLIGNSPRVSDDMGSLIDSGKFNVIRFNDFRTHGYEHKIGTKTDIWIVNQLICCSNPSHKKYDKRFGMFRSTGKYITYPFLKFFQDPLKSVPTLPSDYYLHKKYKFNDTFSTGMYMILLCLECGKTPYIYGFDLDLTNPTEHIGESTLNDKTGEFFSFGHNWSDEKKLINNLIQKNLVIQLNNGYSYLRDT